MPKMKISLVQTASLPMEIEKNFEKTKKRLTEAVGEKPDVLVLPEAWNNGFRPEMLIDVEDLMEEEILAYLKSFSREHGVNLVAGSLTYRESGKIKNRTYIIDRAGEIITHYDKVHLFSYGGEDQAYTPGDEPGIFQLDGVNCAVATCYDMRFPEWSRILAQGGKGRILFVPATWPEKRLPQLELLIKARAIENNWYLVFLNEALTEKSTGLGAGNSMVIDPLGRELIRLGKGEETKTVEVDLTYIDHLREKINVWKDRRPELYRGLDQ